MEEQKILEILSENLTFSRWFDSTKERAESLLDCEFEEKVTLKDIIEFYFSAKKEVTKPLIWNNTEIKTEEELLEILSKEKSHYFLIIEEERLKCFYCGKEIIFAEGYQIEEIKNQNIIFCENCYKTVPTIEIKNKQAEKAFNENSEASKRIWKLYDETYIKAKKEAEKKERNISLCQNLQNKK